jgi:hypothetical protein
VDQRRFELLTFGFPSVLELFVSWMMLSTILVR